MPNASIDAVHPLYATWKGQWSVLSDAYEGGGGFLDGFYLVPHPREVRYQVDSDGKPTSTVLSEKPKFIRRKQIARYENWAAALVDTLISHQFADPIGRTIGNRRPDPSHPLAMFWEDVDGAGTHINDWIPLQQTIADIFGHVFLVMDREQNDTETDTQTQANQPRLRVVSYAPTDVPDWLVHQRKLQSIHTVESVPRTSLKEIPSDDLIHRIWDADTWQEFNTDGQPTRSEPHGFNELPVVVFRARPRGVTQVLGRSVLGDAGLYVDQYNLTSELREILRAQTFSILKIQLGDNETVEEARANIGVSSGTDNVMFTRADAGYLAPPNGPADVIADQLVALARSMFRASGIPWESDSRDAEAAGSLKIKRGELDRRLARHALEAQRVEYAIARLFYIGQWGPEEGLRRWEQDDVQIIHPTEFVTDGALPLIEEAREAIGLPLGVTAKHAILSRLVGKVIEDLSPEERQAIDVEIGQELVTPEPAPPQPPPDDDEPPPEEDA